MRIRLKKVRVKCMVKGCRNSGNKVATFNVSASHEFGKGVIMCAECIKDANEALMAMTKTETTPETAENVEATVTPAEEAVEEKPKKTRSNKASA